MADVSVERSESRALPLGDPAPLGLSGFALTTFVLSASNAGFLFTFGNGGAIVAATAIFYGGIAQLLAGMWEFRNGNTFGATAFTSYGAFWLALGVVLFPPSGIAAALVKEGDINTAIGVFLLGWTIFTGFMFLGTLRLSGALVGVFGFLFLAFLFLTIGKLGGSNTMYQVGGWLGIITALVAWYTAAAGVLAKTNSAIRLPTFPLG
ncbi:MAG TPA: acetate uptake transporter [Ktedonobacteraceae bacterium]|nr:acetate uptake transporter [Ktedonobacteraceae bacterium]